jgi:hypothetical protein
MTNNIGRPPEAWRNYSTKIPIAAFRIKRDELKRLYQIIHAKQIEYRDKVVATLSRMPSESNDDFEGEAKGARRFRNLGYRYGARRRDGSRKCRRLL